MWTSQILEGWCIGASLNAEEYLKEAGSSGRDGKSVQAISYEGKGEGDFSKLVKEYASNCSTCRSSVVSWASLKRYCSN